MNLKAHFSGMCGEGLDRWQEAAKPGLVRAPTGARTEPNFGDSSRQVFTAQNVE
jgi:hypothetical protein